MPDWSTVEYPKTFEESHTIGSTRIEGERFLSRLCTQSAVEYAWEFDDSEQAWAYTPGVASQTVRQIPWTNVIFSVKNQLKLEEHTLHPVGSASSHYHIHPDVNATIRSRWVPRALGVQQQMPSTDDINFCTNATSNGYRDIRIVTSFGVTTVTHNPDLIETGTIRNFSSIKVGGKELQRIVDRRGVAEAISVTFGRLNEHYEGVFAFSFLQLQDERE